MLHRIGRRITAMAVLLGCLGIGASDTAAADPDSEPTPKVAAHLGIGVPELLHAELGYFVSRRLLVEVQYKNAIFNHLVGVGATGHLFGMLDADKPAWHSLLLSGSMLVNPTLGELRLQSGGDVIGASAAAYVGWGIRTADDFSYRLMVGALILDDNGLAGGPTLHIGLGRAF